MNLWLLALAGAGAALALKKKPVTTITPTSSPPPVNPIVLPHPPVTAPTTTIKTLTTDYGTVQWAAKAGPNTLPYYGRYIGFMGAGGTSIFGYFDASGIPPNPPKGATATLTGLPGYTPGSTSLERDPLQYDGEKWINLAAAVST